MGRRKGNRAGSTVNQSLNNGDGNIKEAIHHHKNHKFGNDGPGADLLTPTSISMKNAFIIKNAD